MPYTPVHADWKDANSATGGGDTTTPIGAADLEHIETGIATATTGAETAITNVANHLADTSDAHDASTISVADTAGYFTATDVEGSLAEIVPQLASSVPTGVVSSFAGSAAPNGWLMCNGSTASTATYPTLYALCGTTYGSTGSGFFTLPDFRGRVAVGLGTHADVNALGDSDGEATVGNRRPKHYHTTQVVGTNGTGGVWHNAGLSGGTPGYVNTDLGATNNIKDTPAYLVINYIIKT